MAHGKSLEMREISAPEPQLLCKCGKVWESEAHFTKKGELRKNLDRTKHHGLGNHGGRGSGYRRPSIGHDRPSLASKTKGQTRLASIYGPAMPSRKALRDLERQKKVRQP